MPKLRDILPSLIAGVAGGGGYVIWNGWRKRDGSGVGVSRVSNGRVMGIILPPADDEVQIAAAAS